MNKLCSECLSLAIITNWKPPPGIDPRMREFICPHCGNKFYVRCGREELEREKERGDDKMAQPAMQILAEKVHEAMGLEWGIAHRSLRSYVHKLTDEQFQEEVSRVDNPKTFGVLWSIGLSNDRQVWCMLRWSELKK